MQDRIYRDENLGKNVDEHLEVVFKEVYDWEISDNDAIATLLDPYTQRIFGADYVPFATALDDLSHTIRWAMQFGELRLFPITAEDTSVIRAEFGDKIINYGAKIGDDKQGELRAYGATLIQVIVLAGVQVLREYAYELLNTKAGSTAH
jgi:hypothetical protein